MTTKYTGVSAATGIALKLPAEAGGHPTLWNPAGSNVNVAIRRLELSYVTGNNAPIAVEWASVSHAGSTHGTGAPVATATIVDPLAVLGGGRTNKAKWSPTTNSFTAAPSFIRPAGLSLFTGLAATAIAPVVLRVDYDADDFVIGPGVAVCLCTQSTTTTAAFQVAVTWEEIATT